MKYIEVDKTELWTDPSMGATLNAETMQWEPGRPALYPYNIKEWFIHTILRKHFSFGQPYCVICGYGEKTH